MEPLSSRFAPGPARRARRSPFLGVESRDVTNALIAGGVLLAIAGAGFAGSAAWGHGAPGLTTPPPNEGCDSLPN